MMSLRRAEDHTYIAQLLGRLVRARQQRGLVEKREHTTDRRTQGLYVTPPGCRGAGPGTGNG